MLILSRLNLCLFCLVVSSLFSAGCVTTDNPVSQSEKEIGARTHQRIFIASFDSVWRAAQLSLRYPISLNNMDEGVIETDWIDALDGFEPAHAPPTAESYRYKIKMLFAKGRTQGSPSVRVTILKQIETPEGFFNPGRSLESNGLEETVLFYRMEREITIDEAIKAESKRSRR